MADKLSYEQAYAKLEELVKNMENGNLTLDQSIKAYEEGSALLKICEEELAKYEEIINKLGEKA